MLSTLQPVNMRTNSDLVQEANERIRFSINFDARKISNVKDDLSKMKQDIHDLKNDLKSAEQPLMVRSRNLLRDSLN